MARGGFSGDNACSPAQQPADIVPAVDDGATAAEAAQLVPDLRNGSMRPSTIEPNARAAHGGVTEQGAHVDFREPGVAAALRDLTEQVRNLRTSAAGAQPEAPASREVGELLYVCACLLASSPWPLTFCQPHCQHNTRVHQRAHARAMLSDTSPHHHDPAAMQPATGQNMTMFRLVQTTGVQTASMAPRDSTTTAAQTVQTAVPLHDSASSPPAHPPLLERLLALAPDAAALRASLPAVGDKPLPADSLATSSGAHQGLCRKCCEP